ncbi:MAG: hypothetical protein MHMPM18_004885 [Marteilia pararefringens]
MNTFKLFGRQILRSNRLALKRRKERLLSGRHKPFYSGTLRQYLTASQTAADLRDQSQTSASVYLRNEKNYQQYCGDY